jgi:hypothetical protein
MSESIRGRHLPRLLAVAAALLCADAAMALKVDMYAIGNWSGGNCAPGNTGLDRSAWPGMAQAWYDWMGLMGETKTGKFVDGNMTVQRICDPAVNGSCQDWAYIDWPDAAILAAHGSDGGNKWSVLMRNTWAGTCNGTMGQAPDNMNLGDNNLKFMHASSCLSLNDNYFPYTRDSMQKAGVQKALHLMTGFHGVMWIGGGFNGDYAATAIDGHITGVANAWVTHHYKSNQFACAWYDPFNLFGTCQDQCPTAYAIGTSGAAALNRLLNERYNNSAAFGSPKPNASTPANYYAWMGYLGCDPVAQDGFAP